MSHFSKQQLNHGETADTIVCDYTFEPVSTMYVVLKIISSRLSSNSEALASEY